MGLWGSGAWTGQAPAHELLVPLELVLVLALVLLGALGALAVLASALLQA